MARAEVRRVRSVDRCALGFASVLCFVLSACALRRVDSAQKIEELATDNIVISSQHYPQRGASKQESNAEVETWTCRAKRQINSEYLAVIESVIDNEEARQASSNWCFDCKSSFFYLVWVGPDGMAGLPRNGINVGTWGPLGVGSRNLGVPIRFDFLIMDLEADAQLERLRSSDQNQTEILIGSSLVRRVGNKRSITYITISDRSHLDAIRYSNSWRAQLRKNGVLQDVEVHPLPFWTMVERAYESVQSDLMRLELDPSSNCIPNFSNDDPQVDE